MVRRSSSEEELIKPEQRHYAQRRPRTSSSADSSNPASDSPNNPNGGSGTYGSTSPHKHSNGNNNATLPTVSLRVDRAVLDQRQVQGKYHYHGKALPPSAPRPPFKGSDDQDTSFCARLGNVCSGKSAASAVKSVFPIVDWLGHYKVREDLVGDLVSGFTVAVMHIPQGLAYALLGNVPPVVGIYMAFFPVLIYCLFGTSRHVSMGTFAVICLMTGRVVVSHTTHHDSGGGDVNATAIPLPSPMEVASAVTAVVGAVQLIMWMLRLGLLSVLLSEALVSGFTTAAAIHVLTSQLKDLLGITLNQKPKGAFKIVMTWVEIGANIGSANVAAVVVSLVTMVLLTVNNEALKPWLARRCPLPVPIELLIVIAGTLLSAGPTAPLAGYSLPPLGHIPTGFPAPTPPSTELLWSVALESIPIAVVAYTIAMSLALIFATKNGYEVRPNQELLALGASNVVGCLFSCMPVTASLSRSAVQEAAGGRTQLTSLVSCGLLTFVLLWAGPFFEPLPRCFLAAIIVVALRGMLMQIREGPKFIRNSRWDGVVWLITFLSVVFIDIDVGLGVGACLSLVALLCQGLRPVCHLLAPLPGTDLYVDPTLYAKASKIPGLAIFRYAGVINFATRSSFKDQVYKYVGVNPEKELARQRKAQRGILREAMGATGSMDNFVEEMKRQEPVELYAVVIDMSGVVRVDPEGVRSILGVSNQYAQLRVTVSLAAASDMVLNVLHKCGADHIPMYPSVHDAVTASITNQLNARI